MRRGPIPTDLVIEIFSRLPEKSVARFHSLSKLWACELRRPDFTELFLTRSSARPSLLFAVKLNGVWSFYSSPQLQNPYDKSSSLIVAADFHLKLPRDNMRFHISPQFSCDYAFGLICFHGMWISEEDDYYKSVICNPNTGLYAILPKLRRYPSWGNMLGYDPIDKQFKVLSLNLHDHDHRILTLGTGEMSWRKIQFPLIHYLYSPKGVCINGVLYYLAAFKNSVVKMVVCFDVRSEIFKMVVCSNLESDGDYYGMLVNYKGKLGAISWKKASACTVRGTIELRMWLLEDVEKSEWSKHVYTFQDNKLIDCKAVSIAGVTATGEIVLSMRKNTSTPFYVFYFNPEINTLQAVEIQGFRDSDEESSFHKKVCTFVDHVENLNINDAKLFKSSISAPSLKIDMDRSYDDGVSREKIHSERN